jgi:uncharacterized protein with LGFP repeats
MFFDYNALTAQQTQDFIAAKGASCKPSSGGIPCLKDYRENTFTRAPDGICKGSYYGAGGEAAGMIIWKVAQACQISEKVLLVLLQKEQALVTASGASLTARRYQIAAGMGCPDTAACDTQYYGFYNQVYSAAHQYQRYATYPKNYSYRAGVTNTIYWSPTASCGTSQVYIANQATAGLYDYTPYRPNAAALRAGYGTGDGCSAYGNRNFWLYFTDWFGSTQSPGGDAILAGYAARGGATGPLGPYTTWVICGMAGGGCGQVFQNGTLYWSASTGVHAVSDPYLTAWGWLREGGPLGYPTTDLICGLANGGCGQVFQGGRVYNSPATGTFALYGPIHASWVARGYEVGPLGYPTSDMICGLKDNGCGQVFQGGTLYTSPKAGTHALTNGDVSAAWVAQGWENGPLGYPVTDQSCGMKESGCGQAFENGRLYYTPGTGAHPVLGSINAEWMAQGYEAGTLGYATADQVCGLTDSGCRQDFQGGRIYSSKSAGAHAISGALQTVWNAQGGETGPLGYPISDQGCGMKDSGCGQAFQGGRIYSSTASGTHAISGTIQNAWIAQGWENGTLGYPTGDQVCGLAGGGCKQDFQGGTLYSQSTAGTYALSGPIAAAWVASGGESGPLGYPVTGLICGMKNSGCGQVFSGGRIYQTAATGAHAVSGPIQNAWIAQGWEAGALGYPTGDQVCGLAGGGCKQDFQGGTLYTSGTGTYAVSGAILTAWQAAGAEGGPLGYPTTGLICGLKSSGCGQVFQGGRIYNTAATGAHALSGAIHTAWVAQGWETGPLGYATGDQVCGLAGGGCKQTFQGGTMYTSGVGTYAVSGTILTAWAATGAESGALGYPTTGLICGLKSGGCGQVFQNGRIYTTTATGAHSVSGPIQTAWIAQGWETGSLGYPTTEPYAVPGGTKQDFQGGHLTLDTATGTVTRS